MTVKELLPEVKENISLAQYTTFRIGGDARYFFVAKTKNDLIGAVKAAQKNNSPFFILGGGSNLLVSDEGFEGLVIKIQNTKYKIQNNKIYAEAGTPLSVLVNGAIKNNLTGLEWAAGIPGTVGGAIYGNSGTREGDMKDVVESVEVFDTQALRTKRLSNKDCRFQYRNSSFKDKKNLVIISAVLKLKKGNKEIIKEKIKEIISRRQKSQPWNFPSAGSIFKNPPGFFAAELIERCGLKGKKIGNVKISERHANFIVNLGEGKEKDVKKIIKLAKIKIKKKFGVNLEEEVVFIPPRKNVCG